MAAVANLTWNAASGATTYLVEYKLQSSGTYITAPGSNPTGGLSYSVTGLESGKAYDFRVSSNCTTGSGIVIQQGTTPCINVTGFSAGFLSSGTAALQWDRLPEAVSYIVEYKIQSTSTYTAAAGSPLANPGTGATVAFNIVGLTEGNVYDFRVRTNCTVGTSAGIVAQATSSCPAPTNLNVSFS